VKVQENFNQHESLTFFFEYRKESEIDFCFSPPIPCSEIPRSAFVSKSDVCFVFSWEIYMKKEKSAVCKSAEPKGGIKHHTICHSNMKINHINEKLSSQSAFGFLKFWYFHGQRQISGFSSVILTFL
jgi:hypothetical protein